MEIMRFDAFAKAVTEQIKGFLPESFADAKVELLTVAKNNGLELTGLTIRRKESSICPTIYLEEFYRAYSDGDEMEEVLSRIADMRLRTEVENPFDVSDIEDFVKTKDKILPRLICKKLNQKLLRDRPHTGFADLAVTYHIRLSDIASIAVTTALMEVWGVDVDVLHAQALRNMPKLTPSTFRGMSAVLSGKVPGMHESLPEEDEAMFVLTNRDNHYGAAALLDEDILHSIVERLGESFYILPSSVHEVIVLPNTADIYPNVLTEMVKSVNVAQVPPEERLSDHAYRYTVTDGLQAL